MSPRKKTTGPAAAAATKTKKSPYNSKISTTDSLGGMKLKIDLEKYLEGLVKLVMTSYRLGEMAGGIG